MERRSGASPSGSVRRGRKSAAPCGRRAARPGAGVPCWEGCGRIVLPARPRLSPGGAADRGAGCGSRGRRLCLFTSPPQALARGGPAVPHYASGRAGAGLGTWLPLRAVPCGGTGEPSLRARPGCQGHRAGLAGLCRVWGVCAAAVLCLASALKEHGGDAPGSWFDVIGRIDAGEAALV